MLRSPLGDRQRLKNGRDPDIVKPAILTRSEKRADMNAFASSMSFVG
jgi:hypothetical protein